MLAIGNADYHIVDLFLFKSTIVCQRQIKHLQHTSASMMRKTFESLKQIVRVMTRDVTSKSVKMFSQTMGS